MPPTRKKSARRPTHNRLAAPASNIARRRATALEEGREAYLERRSEILAAAAAVFKERGFRGATLAHVAEALGTDRATLYYYVGSKEEMFHDIVTHVVEANLNSALAVRASNMPAPEKLRSLIVGLMESYAGSYPMLYVLIQENLSHVVPAHSDWARKVRHINRRWERALIDIIEQGQADGTLRDSTPAWLVAYAILGSLGWTNRWFNPKKSPLPARDIGEGIADTLLAGIVAADS